MTNVIRGTKGGDVVVKVGILYDDGDEEVRTWPDIDILVVDRVENNEEKKDKKKSRKDEVGNGSPRTFICGEGGCEYEGKVSRDLKRHKAAIHDIDLTYY